MNTHLTAFLVLTLLAAAPLNAQTTTTSPAASIPAAEREEATGNITDITPDRSLVLHTGTNAGEDVVFRFAPKVTYVDADGRIVEAAGLRKNLRVRVSFLKVGGDNIIDKVTILD